MQLASKKLTIPYLPTCLIYNRLIGYECMWVLGIICFSHVICKMINPIRDMENRTVFTVCFVFTVIIHLKNRM